MWLLYCWILTRLLDANALGEALYALVFSGLAGAIISAGWGQVLLRDGSRFVQECQTDRMASLTSNAARRGSRRIAVLCLGVTFVYSTGLMPTPIGTASVAILTCAIAGILGLILIYSAAHRANGHLVTALIGQGLMRASLPLAFTLVCSFIWPVTVESVLLVHLGSLCLILSWLWHGVPRATMRLQDQAPDKISLRYLSLGQVGYALFSHMDVLVMGWTIGTSEAGAYLIVRRIAGLLGLVFEALRNAVTPSLSVAFYRNKPLETAAIINRMFLWVGGAAAALLLLMAGAILPQFGVAHATTGFYWLVLGGITPAMFGATGLLMTMGGLERLRLWQILGLLPISIAVLAWAASRGITDLAMAAAMMQLVVGAIGAISVNHQFGIRPGVLSLGHFWRVRGV